MQGTRKLFVPVCLYPHTKYRETEGVSALFSKFELYRNEYLIVIADRLQVLDHLVTGRYWSEQSATIKARREAEQISRLIAKVARKLDARALGKILFWNDVADTLEYCRFASLIRSKLMSEHGYVTIVNEFVNRRVNRFALGGSPEDEREYEREYLLSEVSMSVFCTEVLGFWNEVWERPLVAEAPDPLKTLYEKHQDIVAECVEHPPQRVLSFLYEIR